MSDKKESKFPCRIITHVDGMYNKCKKSYGLIVYSRDNKWLLVREKYSPFFVIIMKGIYRDSYIPFLVSHLTQGEVELLKQFLADETKLYKYYDILFTARSEIRSPQYTLKRLRSPSMVRALQESINNCKERWGFPAGKPKYKEKAVHCALRECKEESGISIIDGDMILPQIITETIYLISGGVLCKDYWPCIINRRDMPPDVSRGTSVDASGDTVTDQNEISEVRWVSDKDIEQILQKDKIDILTQARKAVFSFLGQKTL